MNKTFVFLGSLVLGLCGLAQGDLNDGLIAYYPFNGNANDESGNGINGIVNGATLAEDRFGETNNAHSFDGNDFVSMGNPPSLRLSEDFTISSWALFSSNSGTDRILSFNQEFGYELGIWDGNPWFAYGRTNHRSSQVIQPNTWFNLTVTKAGNLINLYLNGVKILEESNTNNPTFSRELRFGQKSQQDSWWTGKIDDTRFYDRALTNEEIVNLYTSEGQPSRQLVINEQFNDADLENFDITRQNISINDGFLKTSGRGTIVSKEEILGPKRIKLRVRPDSGVETFSVAIATGGNTVGGFAELSGLLATWSTDYSQLAWIDREQAQAPEELRMAFPAGQWFDIEIIDNITSASLIVNGTTQLDIDLSDYDRSGNKVALYSREVGGGSTVDYFTVETLDPVSPAAPVVQLGALYESPSGEAIIIDATPTAGFPAEYTYQWCFNGLKVPAALGGTSSIFGIDSLQANEGTWSVTVTNETGSVEQSFEYRIYADADNDGLSDAYEELISQTDINNGDTDNDGLGDAEEFNTHGTNPNSPDSDSDGFTDLYELEAAYDPNSAESVPDALVNIMTAIEVKFNAALGATYAIEFSTDSQNWNVIEDDIVGEGGAVERLYSKQNFPTGFFRVERTDQ